MIILWHPDSSSLVNHLLWNVLQLHLTEYKNKRLANSFLDPRRGKNCFPFLHNLEYIRWENDDQGDYRNQQQDYDSRDMHPSIKSKRWRYLISRKKLLRCVMSVVNSVKNFMKSNFTVGVLQLKSQKYNQMTSSHNLIPWRNHKMK